MSTPTPIPDRRRRRFLPLVWLGSLVAFGALALGVTSTISGFGASITNNSNSVSTGTLTLSETGPGSSGTPVTCLSTTGGGVCSTINKYGNAGPTDTTLAPGQTITTTVSLTNTGTTPAGTFTLTPGTCTSTGSGSGNLCSELQITLTGFAGVGTGGASVMPTTPSGAAVSPTALNTNGPFTFKTGLAAGATDTFVFVVALPAAADNTYQGLTATQSLVWNLVT